MQKVFQAGVRVPW